MVNNEIKEEIKRYLETSENEDTTIQNLWDTGNADLRWKFIALQVYLKKQEKAQIKNVTLHLKKLEKKQQTKPKVSRRKKIIKIRAEVKETEYKKMEQNIHKSKSQFFEKIDKIHKLLTRLIKKKREWAKMNKIRYERGEMTTDAKEIQRIVKKYYEQVYINKLDNLDEMDKFLGMYNLPKLNQKEPENMNRQITPREIEAVIKTRPPNQKSWTRWLHR